MSRTVMMRPTWVRVLRAIVAYLLYPAVVVRRWFRQ